MNFRAVLLGLVVVAMACSTASAHPGHTETADDGAAHGLMAGFAHPWFGVDHLLAMVAVGLLSVQLGGRAMWVLPLSFVGAMVVGGAAGIGGGDLPLVEFGIALSVVVLGAALAFGRRHALVTASIVIAGFGLLHGHAHGTEMPTLASPAMYAAGFVAATALLHLMAIFAGNAIQHAKQRTAGLRLSGAAIACAGLWLVAGLI